MLSQLKGQMLLDIMDDHGLGQMIHFPTHNKNTLDLILTSLPGQCQDIHSPDKLSDHTIISGFSRIFIPHIKKPRRKVYSYQEGDFETMRKDVLRFAQKYFNGHSDVWSVQMNFTFNHSFMIQLISISPQNLVGRSLWFLVNNLVHVHVGDVKQIPETSTDT